MELKTVKMEIPEGANMVIGQTHFIKSVEDLYEVMVGMFLTPGLELPFVRLLLPVWYGRKAMIRNYRDCSEKCLLFSLRTHIREYYDPLCHTKRFYVVKV